MTSRNTKQSNNNMNSNMNNQLTNETPRQNADSMPVKQQQTTLRTSEMEDEFDKPVGIGEVGSVVRVEDQEDIANFYQSLKGKPKRPRGRRTKGLPKPEVKKLGADYSYAELLEMLYAKMKGDRPGKPITSNIPIPQLGKDGGRKTLWRNFRETCQAIGRKEEHVMNFFLIEFGCKGSLDGSHRLSMRGTFRPREVMAVMRRYLDEYVKCRMCRTRNTTLTRDDATRLSMVHCQQCLSRRAVAPMQKLFHAPTRGDRKRR